MGSYHLFSNRELGDLILSRAKAMSQAIGDYDSDDLLHCDLEELSSYFEQNYLLDPVDITEEIKISTDEIKIEISRDASSYLADRNKPFYASGLRINYHIPYIGNAELLTCSPTSLSYDHPPKATVTDEEIILSYETEFSNNALTDEQRHDIMTKFVNQLNKIKLYSQTIKNEIGAYNCSVKDAAQKAILERREILSATQQFTEFIGFPLKKRSVAEEVLTTSHKAIALLDEAQKTKAPKPLPALKMEDYEQLLEVISDLVSIMELSPCALRKMKEEELRDLLLVYLNGYYDAQPGGETFSFADKSDIVIQAAEKKIFVAECRFWSGPKELLNTVDQVLKQANAKDSKAAILVFNRRNNFARLMKSLPKIIQSHANYAGAVEMASTNSCRFMLTHPDHRVKRELILTILVFEIPGESA